MSHTEFACCSSTSAVRGRYWANMESPVLAEKVHPFDVSHSESITPLGDCPEGK